MFSAKLFFKISAALILADVLVRLLNNVNPVSTLVIFNSRDSPPRYLLSLIAIK